MIDLDKLLVDLKMTQKELALFLRKVPSSITKVRKGEMKFPEEWKKIILEKFQINVEDYKLKNSDISNNNNVNEPLTDYKATTNKSQDKSTYSNQAVIVRPDFIEVPYLSVGMYSNYIDSLAKGIKPKLENMMVLKNEVVANEQSQVIELLGEAMSDNSDRSIMDGDKVLAVEVPREKWAEPLKFNQYLCIIVAPDGIICRQVVGHDLEAGTITCHAWNPRYKDVVVDLKNVYQIFYAIEIVRKRIKF